MQPSVLRKLFLGFIQIHILYHAQQEPIYGVWMLEELKRHGYELSPGTLYPILHSMEANRILSMKEQVIEGKIRKYYRTTDLGFVMLQEARDKAYELYLDIKEQADEEARPVLLKREIVQPKGGYASGQS